MTTMSITGSPPFSISRLKSSIEVVYQTQRAIPHGDYSNTDVLRLENLVGETQIQLCSPVVVVVTGCAAVGLCREGANGKCLCGALLADGSVGGKVAWCWLGIGCCCHRCINIILHDMLKRQTVLMRNCLWVGWFCWCYCTWCHGDTCCRIDPLPWWRVCRSWCVLYIGWWRLP